MGSINLQSEGYDVVICGAGLAGLTLARQLKQQMPDLSVCLIDRLSRPLPEAAFKVGESLVETGSHYLRETIDLADYLDEFHIRKLGFRFFFQNGSDRFENRPEFGLRMFPRVNSYQLDRGVLENDLRRFDEEDGVILLEGYDVRDVVLAEDDDLHEVHYENADSSDVGIARARWVVDAMGRRRFLQKRLGLTKEHGRKCSAVWFRIRGLVDVSDLVPREESEWHERVPDNTRFYSTNHLMGDGYWIWIIPLGSGHTSVGICAMEEMHDFSDFNTYDRALEWLEQHEPALASYLGDRETLDFRCMRRYSYASEQLFSLRRWACTGESALFPDPFYALAGDLIGFENTMITDMVRRDREGNLNQKTVTKYNETVLALNYWLTNNIQEGYRFFGNGLIMANKVMWDTAGGWSALGPQMFNEIFLDDELGQKFRKASGGFFFLTRAMQNLFADWADLSQGRLSFDFIDFLSVPIMKEIQKRNLRSGKTPEEIVEDQVTNMQRLEEMAQAIFLVAVEDTLPEHLERFEDSAWLNAWAIGLDPEKWEPNGLFRPTSPPRDLHAARQQIRILFRDVNS